MSLLKDALDPEKIFTRLGASSKGVVAARHTTHPELFSMLLNWDVSHDIWAGYDQTGKETAMPTEARRQYRFRLDNGSDRDPDPQQVETFTVPSQPLASWVWIYDSLKPFADANGQHMGVHPSKTALVPRYYSDLLWMAMGAVLPLLPRKQAVTTIRMNLRERPRDDATIVKSVARQTPIIICGDGVSYDKNMWFPVRLESGVAGWMSDIGIKEL